MFTDDGDTLVDAGLLRRAMEYLVDRGGVIAQHAEDPGLAQGGHMHEGSVSSRLGMRGLPALAEEIIVARDLALVEVIGAPYHVQHVSTAGTVALVRDAKQRGLPVTAEVTPHHLIFDHHEVEAMDPDFKMYPPLRTPDDVAELRRALEDGTIDAVATDHAPHQGDEKDVGFSEAPRGVIGLETAAAVVWGALRDSDALFRVLSTSPATVAGLSAHGQTVQPGNRANLVVFAPDETWTVRSFRSKSANSPYLGAEMVGRVKTTVHDGSVTYQFGEK